MTTLLDVPILFVMSLWTILRIGHCYGYALDQRRDRHFVLGVLIAAISGSLETKRQRLDDLHELESLLLEETQEDIVAEEVLSILFQLEIFGEIPGVGALSGAFLNLTFMRRVENTARRVFQERWLRDGGKVRSIAPAEAHARDLAGGWAGALGRLAYSGCYCAGFGVALPVTIVASLFSSQDNAMVRGVRDGGLDAQQKASLALGPPERTSAPRRRGRTRVAATGLSLTACR